VQVEKAGEDDFLLARLPEFDLGDEVVLDRQDARPGPSDRVNEKSL
jgi:hypothetical protein